MQIITIILFVTISLTSSLQAQIVVGIAGGSGSGKTTLAHKIQNYFGDDAILISQDSYYKDFSSLPVNERENVNFDHPESLDFSLMAQQLEELKNDKVILQPIYDYATHSRLNNSKKVQPKNLIIVEGILILADSTLRDMFDLKIFIDTDDDIRILRRMKRDILERGRTFESVNKQYVKTVKPMYKKFVKPSMSNADIVVYGVKENVSVITKLITSYLED